MEDYICLSHHKAALNNNELFLKSPKTRGGLTNFDALNCDVLSYFLAHVFTEYSTVLGQLVGEAGDL